MASLLNARTLATQPNQQLTQDIRAVQRGLVVANDTERTQRIQKLQADLKARQIEQLQLLNQLELDPTSVVLAQQAAQLSQEITRTQQTIEVDVALRDRVLDDAAAALQNPSHLPIQNANTSSIPLARAQIDDTFNTASATQNRIITELLAQQLALGGNAGPYAQKLLRNAIEKYQTVVFTNPFSQDGFVRAMNDLRAFSQRLPSQPAVTVDLDILAENGPVMQFVRLMQDPSRTAVEVQSAQTKALTTIDDEATKVRARIQSVDVYTTWSLQVPEPSNEDDLANWYGQLAWLVWATCARAASLHLYAQSETRGQLVNLLSIKESVLLAYSPDSTAQRMALRQEIETRKQEMRDLAALAPQLLGPAQGTARLEFPAIWRVLLAKLNTFYDALIRNPLPPQVPSVDNQRKVMITTLLAAREGVETLRTLSPNACLDSAASLLDAFTSCAAQSNGACTLGALSSAECGSIPFGKDVYELRTKLRNITRALTAAVCAEGDSQGLCEAKTNQVAQQLLEAELLDKALPFLFDKVLNQWQTSNDAVRIRYQSETATGSSAPLVPQNQIAARAVETQQPAPVVTAPVVAPAAPVVPPAALVIPPAAPVMPPAAPVVPPAAPVVPPAAPVVPPTAPVVPPPAPVVPPAAPIAPVAADVGVSSAAVSSASQQPGIPNFGSLEAIVAFDDSAEGQAEDINERRSRFVDWHSDMIRPIKPLSPEGCFGNPKTNKNPFVFTQDVATSEAFALCLSGTKPSAASLKTTPVVTLSPETIAELNDQLAQWRKDFASVSEANGAMVRAKSDGFVTARDNFVAAWQKLNLQTQNMQSLLANGAVTTTPPTPANKGPAALPTEITITSSTTLPAKTPVQKGVAAKQPEPVEEAKPVEPEPAKVLMVPTLQTPSVIPFSVCTTLFGESDLTLAQWRLAVADCEAKKCADKKTSVGLFGAARIECLRNARASCLPDPETKFATLDPSQKSAVTKCETDKCNRPSAESENDRNDCAWQSEILAKSLPSRVEEARLGVDKVFANWQAVRKQIWDNDALRAQLGADLSNLATNPSNADVGAVQDAVDAKFKELVAAETVAATLRTTFQEGETRYYQRLFESFAGVSALPDKDAVVPPPQTQSQNPACQTSNRPIREFATQTTADWRLSKQECETTCPATGSCTEETVSAIFAKRSREAQIPASELVDFDRDADRLKVATNQQHLALQDLQKTYEQWGKALTDFKSLPEQASDGAKQDSLRNFTNAQRQFEAAQVRFLAIKKDVVQRQTSLDLQLLLPRLQGTSAAGPCSQQSLFFANNASFPSISPDVVVVNDDQKHALLAWGSSARAEISKRCFALEGKPKTAFQQLQFEAYKMSFAVVAEKEIDEAAMRLDAALERSTSSASRPVSEGLAQEIEREDALFSQIVKQRDLQNADGSPKEFATLLQIGQWQQDLESKRAQLQAMIKNRVESSDLRTAIADLDRLVARAGDSDFVDLGTRAYRRVLNVVNAARHSNDPEAFLQDDEKVLAIASRTDLSPSYEDFYYWRNIDATLSTMRFCLEQFPVDATHSSAAYDACVSYQQYRLRTPPPPALSGSDAERKAQLKQQTAQSFQLAQQADAAKTIYDGPQPALDPATVSDLEAKQQQLKDMLNAYFVHDGVPRTLHSLLDPNANTEEDVRNNLSQTDRVRIMQNPSNAFYDWGTALKQLRLLSATQANIREVVEQENANSGLTCDTIAPSFPELGELCNRKTQCIITEEGALTGFSPTEKCDTILEWMQSEYQAYTALDATVQDPELREILKYSFLQRMNVVLDNVVNARPYWQEAFDLSRELKTTSRTGSYAKLLEDLKVAQTSFHDDLAKKVKVKKLPKDERVKRDVVNSILSQLVLAAQDGVEYITIKLALARNLASLQDRRDDPLFKDILATDRKCVDDLQAVLQLQTSVHAPEIVGKPSVDENGVRAPNITAERTSTELTGLGRLFELPLATTTLYTSYPVACPDTWKRTKSQLEAEMKASDDAYDAVVSVTKDLMDRLQVPLNAEDPQRQGQWDNVQGWGVLVDDENLRNITLLDKEIAEAESRSSELNIALALNRQMREQDPVTQKVSVKSSKLVRNGNKADLTKYRQWIAAVTMHFSRLRRLYTSFNTCASTTEQHAWFTQARRDLVSEERVELIVLANMDPNKLADDIQTNSVLTPQEKQLFTPCDTP